jgi:hypothetical protein
MWLYQHLIATFFAIREKMAKFAATVGGDTLYTGGEMLRTRIQIRVILDDKPMRHMSGI